VLYSYLITFVHGLSVTLVVYYLPTYFQGSKGVSAIRSGVLLFVTALLVGEYLLYFALLIITAPSHYRIYMSLAPMAIATGQSIERTGHYVIQNYIGWVLIIVGYGTMSLLTASSSIAMTQGLQVIGAMGLGIGYTGPQFAILAPLKVEDNAHALALMSYLRTFGQTFGITVGTTILQNGLKADLPKAFLAQFPTGAEISYAIIPLVHALPEPLQSQVKAAFATSISHIWYAVAGLGVLGLLAVVPMRQVVLHEVTDQNWGFEQRSSGFSTPMSDVEKNASAVQT
jgi:hypothetical protein